MASFELFEAVSVVEATAANLRGWILNRAGTRTERVVVTESAVAEQWRVSRPTARSAITLLEGEGLLRREPNKAAYVPSLSGVDVVDLFKIRIAIELEVVKEVAEQRIETGEALLHVLAMETMSSDSTVEAFVRHDLGFHVSLVDSLHSPRMSRVFRSLRGEMHLSMVQSRLHLGPKRIALEHSAILEAIARHDATEARRLMHDHLRKACAEIARAVGTPTDSD